MHTPEQVPFRQRVGLWFESMFMAKLIPRDGISPFLRSVFQAPLVFQRAGLDALIPANVLILTTTGRRSGRPHKTAMEYGPGPREGSLMVMAGWEGRTDWYRNACEDPYVHVWTRGKEWDAVAEPVPDTEVAEMLKRLSQESGAANRVWSRWSGVKIDGSDASYLRAAPHFPSLYLNPVNVAERAAQTAEARRATIELLDCTRRDTRSVLRQLDPELPAYQDERAWTVRDVLAHIGAWNSEAARSLQAHADGGRYICVGGRDECDAYNGPAAEERRKWAIEEVWTEYEVGHDELRKAVETMPAERWYVQMVYPWNERGTVEALVKRMMKHEAADHRSKLTIAD